MRPGRRIQDMTDEEFHAYEAEIDLIYAPIARWSDLDTVNTKVFQLRQLAEQIKANYPRDNTKGSRPLVLKRAKLLLSIGIKVSALKQRLASYADNMSQYAIAEILYGS